MSKVIVEKFGGGLTRHKSPLSLFAPIFERAIQPDDGARRILVFSALNKTTARLKAGFCETPAERAKISLYYDTFVSDLILGRKVERSTREIHLLRMLKSYHEAVKNSPCAYEPQEQAKYLALGELMTSAAAAFYMHKHQGSFELLDARDVIETAGGGYLDCDVDLGASRKLVGHLDEAFEKSNTIITQGFIASNSKSETTLLGFDGSDYSAVIFGVLAGAGEVVLWKDVDGVFDKDPKIFGARVLPFLKYDNALKLVAEGHPVVHSKAIGLAKEHDLHIRVKNFFKPELEGTLIAG